MLVRACYIIIFEETKSGPHDVSFSNSPCVRLARIQQLQEVATPRALPSMCYTPQNTGGMYEWSCPGCGLRPRPSIVYKCRKLELTSASLRRAAMGQKGGRCHYRHPGSKILYAQFIFPHVGLVITIAALGVELCFSLHICSGGFLRPVAPSPPSMFRHT